MALKPRLHDLKSEVQQLNFCGKCGGCVAFCSASNLGALEVGPDGMPDLRMKRNASSAVFVI